MVASWTDAGIILARDPTARITCPEKENAELSVSDHYVAGSQTFERILRCPNAVCLMLLE